MKARTLLVALLIAALAVVSGVMAQDEEAVEIPNVGLVSGSAEGEATALTGTGASFPSALYAAWLDVYVPLTGVDVNYQPTGSSAGIRGISDNSVQFGGTDAAMSDEQIEAAGGNILHIPTALGAVVATYNIPELGETALRLTPDNICLIFLGEGGRTSDRDPIIKWNDERLVADNPELADIDRYIVVVHRADGSGTTDVFTNYLSTVCEDWANIVGRGTSVNWPTGIGARGSAGVAANTAQTPYSITYVEKAFAELNSIPVAVVQNQAGNFIYPSQEATSIAAAEFETPADLRVEIVNAPGEESYPIAAYTWLLVYEEQTNAAEAIALTRFLWWATHDGQQFIYDEAADPVIAGYAALPEPVIRLAEDLILSITVDGEQALPQDIVDASDLAQ
jgi:phosphate transport system substrate-binding protein